MYGQKWWKMVLLMTRYPSFLGSLLFLIVMFSKLRTNYTLLRFDWDKRKKINPQLCCWDEPYCFIWINFYLILFRIFSVFSQKLKQLENYLILSFKGRVFPYLLSECHIATVSKTNCSLAQNDTLSQKNKNGMT